MTPGDQAGTAVDTVVNRVATVAAMAAVATVAREAATVPPAAAMVAAVATVAREAATAAVPPLLVRARAPTNAPCSLGTSASTPRRRRSARCSAERD